jgi:hypothetical protein
MAKRPISYAVLRGKVIETDLIEFGGRGGDLAFLAPDPAMIVDQLALASPRLMEDLYTLSFEDILDYLADVGLLAAIFCATSLVVGYVVPKAFGIVDSQAIASSFEIGVHNGTLAIFVAVEILDNVEISVPAAVYSVVMFVLAALWGMFISRRVGAARESVAA